MADLNVWSDVSSIAQRIESDAYFIVREAGTMLKGIRLSQGSRRLVV